MKKISQRIFIITILSLAALIVLSQTAQAQNPYIVSAVKVTNLDQFHGYYLSAYYALGSAVGVGTDPESITLNKVYSNIRNQILTDSSVLLPTQTIPWIGIAKPNVLVLVIHKNPNFTWKNEDINNTEAVSFVYLRSFSRMPLQNNVRIYNFDNPLNDIQL